MQNPFAAVALATISACAGTAHADRDWGYITAVNPGAVMAFDLASPIGSGTKIGHAQGGFNRGMDFVTENSFYYHVSTDSFNDPGDRGLWFWNNGVNTQLATIPFNDTTDGGGSLDLTNSRYFVAINDSQSPHVDSLYVFDNLGGAVTFTEIGETGLMQILGLAVHPTTGVLYAYDSDTEGLYTIDTATGIPSLVGRNGWTLNSVGGMDFDPTGTLLITAGGILYTANIANGVLTPAGDLGVTADALSYRVPAPGAATLLALGGLAAARRRRA